MILYAGQMMELGSRSALRSRPFHPYSDLLISSVPELRTGWLDGISEVHLKEASTEVPAGRSSEACSFYPRCALRVPGLCDVAPAPIRRLAKGADIRCQRTEEELSNLGQAASSAAGAKASGHLGRAGGSAS
jgi:peptide/nickel transport system ATP-binding protein